MKNFLPIILFFIAFQLKSQTTITWTGNQDSLWNNSLNWSPTQIPNTSNHVVIPSTSIAPQVNVSATILNLTVNSGATLKLNSLLKVRGNLSLNSCNVLGNNTLRADSVASDSLSARNINITNATVSVVISLSGSTINLNGSTFNSKVDARRYNLNNATFGSSSNGGNAFNQKFSFINKSRSQTRFGVTNPDVFNDTVDIKNLNNIFILAHSSQGNEFKKQVKFFLSIQQDPYGAIYIGDQINSNAKFYDNIIYTSLHNNIVFLPVLRLGSNTSGWIELAENKTIVTGNSPMIELQLTKFKKLGSDSFIINNNQLSVLVANRSVFEGPVNWTLNSIRLNGGYFNKNVTIFSNSNRSFPNNISEGNNYFKENFEINRSTNHVYNLANTNPDTCLGNYAVRSTTQQFGSYNVFVNSSGNIIHGDLIAQGVGCNFAINQIASVKILGNFIATNQNFNTSFNGITFGNSNGLTELEGNITINNGNPSSSFISFKNFRKKSANSVTFTNHNGQSWSPIRIENCPEWRGDLNVFGLGAVLNNSTFYGKVKIDLNRLLPQSNGTISSSGGNVFHSKVTLINNVTGSTPIILTGNIPVMHWTWASTLTDTYLDTLYIEKSNSSNLNFVTNGQAILKSSLVVNDLSTNKIKFAEGTGKITFNGDKNQTITSTNNKSIQIKNLEINKENNFVTANDSLLITGNLALTNGVLKTPNVTKPVEIRQNCSITGASSFSYIDGYVLNRQNSIKYFPVGHNNRFMPVYSDSVSAAMQLKVRYRNENSNLVNAHSNRGSFTDSISTKEYWEVLQNNNPNGTINLNLAFDTLGLCNNEISQNIHAVQTQFSTWNKVANQGILQLLNSKVLLKFNLSNEANSLIALSKNNKWCIKLFYQECGNNFDEQSNPITLQNNCCLEFRGYGTISQPNVNSDVSKYHSLNSEILNPLNSDFIPIKTIPINLYVMQRKNKEKKVDYFEDKPEHINLFYKVFENMNEYSVNRFLSDVVKPSDQMVTDEFLIKDSKIRVRLASIRFIEIPDNLFEPNWNTNIMNQQVQWIKNVVGCEYFSGLPWILNENSRGSLDINGVGRIGGSAPLPVCNLNVMQNSTGNYVQSHQWFKTYTINMESDNPGDNSWYFVHHSIHELGHVLGIHHLYDSNFEYDSEPQNFDFLNDVYGIDINNNANIFYGGQFNQNPGPACNNQVDPFINDPTDQCYNIGTNNFVGGLLTGPFISAKQAARMHRSLIYHNVRQLITDCPYSIVPIQINENENWNMNIRIYNDILVKSGNILTISCYVELPDQAKIIVEPGARLIIDGGKLTSSCNMWQGIQVLGIPTSNQGSFTTTLQGYVELKNNALIENAHEGIFMGTNSGIQQQGGIVNAKDATFKNCFRGIAFNPYKFKSISRIDNCYFVCDRPLNDESYVDEFDRKLGTKHHVSLWGINGVLFLNNTFENLIDYSYDVDACTQITGAFAPDIRGDGIACYDASVRLIGTNTNNIDTRNVFKGLTYGISYNQTYNDVSRNISSINSLFENVQYGIYAVNNWNTSLNNNEFKVPGFVDPLNLGNPQTYGAYFFNYNNLRVSNSEFNKYQDNFSPVNRGLITRGFGYNNDYNSNYSNIENNTFDGMKYAFQAERSNSNARLRCNSFNNTQSGGYPWHIAPQFPGFFPDQGISCDPEQYRPGNYFLEEETEHIFSNAWNPWVYYAVNLNGRRPEFATNQFFGFTELCSNANNDPCSTTNGPNWTISQAITKIKQAKTNQGNIKISQDSIKNSLDQGKTVQMINLVEDLLVSRNDLTDSLMLHQPLSNHVLLALTTRDSLISNPQLKMVFSPNLPLDDSIVQPVFEFINRKHSTTIDTLYALQVFNPTSTTIASLEREKRVEKYNELEAIQYVESMFVDSLEYDKLIALYRDTLSADSSYLFPLLGTYLAADSVTSARSLLEDLHIQEFITESFYNYYDLVIGLSEDTLTWFQLDSAKVALLKTIANEESDLALYAQASLELRGDTIIKRHPEESLSGPSGRYSSPEENNTLKISKTEFKLFPNPSNGFIMLESNKRLNELCRIELVDISGRIIYLSNIDFRERNINQINLSGIGSGIYFCRILSNDKQLEVLKFIHQP